MNISNVLLIASCLAAPLALAEPPVVNPPPQVSAPVVGGTVLGVQVEELATLDTGYRASKLLHESVYNDKKEKIGKVDDFIVRPDGKLSYVIIDVGGFLGMGVHRVAIPLHQITGVKPHIFLPGATKDALKAMPAFQYVKS